MSKRFGTSWRRRARGVTLIEVLAGTALLGTLLVSVLVARGKLAEQSRHAAARIEACQVLDEFMETWWPQHAGQAPEGAGDIACRPGWRWQRRIVPNEPAHALRAAVVAVEVFAPGAAGVEPAASVEVLMSYEEMKSKDEETTPKKDGPDAH